MAERFAVGWCTNCSKNKPCYTKNGKPLSICVDCKKQQSAQNYQKKKGRGAAAAKSEDPAAHTGDRSSSSKDTEAATAEENPAFKGDGNAGTEKTKAEGQSKVATTTESSSTILQIAASAESFGKKREQMLQGKVNPITACIALRAELDCALHWLPNGEEGHSGATGAVLQITASAENFAKKRRLMLEGRVDILRECVALRAELDGTLPWLKTAAKATSDAPSK